MNHMGKYSHLKHCANKLDYCDKAKKIINELDINNYNFEHAFCYFQNLFTNTNVSLFGFFDDYVVKVSFDEDSQTVKITKCNKIDITSIQYERQRTNAFNLIFNMNGENCELNSIKDNNDVEIQINYYNDLIKDIINYFNGTII
ncbi:hypothetical protein [Clostridium weizhouense]|uniref:Uncharacterized protein n=1 Tax=Clostridium weizhouense TaxID=2859781 RepID=A0ABS7AJZ1_9CLOT|nr:hypothetical protein [Clostridium weizhouense]MBW6408985.1 hypothetical protein [Clostridium weizhouense]